MQKCDLQAHARKIRAARKLRPLVAKDMRPLFNHILSLSLHSAKVGYCQRAGTEVAQAKRMATKYSIEKYPDMEMSLSGRRRRRRR